MDPVDIVNLALQEIGGLPATSISDTTYPASKAIAQYAISRPQVLRMIPWPRVTHRALIKNMDDQACPWAADTAYFIGDRVTNDTAKTYKCTTAGISDSSGGPTGTGSGIEDNTVVWEYVEASTALNNWSWQASTAYAVNDLVTNDTFKVYKCVTAGTSDASGGPTGVTAAIADNTVIWDYYGTPPRNFTIYTYRYIKPPDCLRILKIPKDAEVYETDQGEQYSLEGITIYCDRNDADMKYLIDETDPDRWDELMHQTVALHVAQAIAMNVTGQKDLAVLMYQKWADQKELAEDVAIIEAKEAPPEPTRWEDA